MKAAGLIVVSMVCAAIGFAVAAFWPGAAPPLAARHLLDSGASSIVSIAIDEGIAERIGPEQWAVTRVEESRGSVRWAGDQVRLRALTRLLANTMALPGGEPVADGPSVVIRTSDGASTQLDFASLIVGGQVGVSISHREAEKSSRTSWTGLVDAELMDVFVGGVEPWLSRAAMPGMPMDPASIEIVTPQERLLLDRLGSRWVMRKPVAGECDADLVKLAARQFAALSGDRLLNDPELFEAPADATWSLSDARRNGKTWQTELLMALGEQQVAVRCRVLDSQGQTVMGPVLMAMDISEAERIDATASAYLSRHTLRLAAADLPVLTVTTHQGELAFVRNASEGNGWFDAQGESTQGVQAVAELLTEHAALIAVPMEQLSDGYTPKFAIRFSTRPPSKPGADLGGMMPMESLSIGLYTSSGRSRLAVEYRGVLRVYDDREAHAAWKWLSELSGSAEEEGR